MKNLQKHWWNRLSKETMSFQEPKQFKGVYAEGCDELSDLMRNFFIAIQNDVTLTPLIDGYTVNISKRQMAMSCKCSYLLVD